jgi:hypothetical protein
MGTTRAGRRAADRAIQRHVARLRRKGESEEVIERIVLLAFELNGSSPETVAYVIRRLRKN